MNHSRPPRSANVLFRPLRTGIVLAASVTAVSGTAAPPAPVLVEAEKAAKPPAVVHRDERASDGRVAVGLLSNKDGKPAEQKLFEHGAPLPAGDYDVTVWMEPKPLSLMHSLAVTIQAGTEQRTLGAIAFDPEGGYQPFTFRFTHPGGNATVRVSATASSGFEGMRRDQSEEEKKAVASIAPSDADSLLSDKPGVDDDEFELEEDPAVDRIPIDMLRLAIDRIEIRLVRTADAVVTAVELDKVHYFPDETVRGTATLASPRGGDYRAVVEVVTEVDAARPVAEQAVTLTPGKSFTLPFECVLDGTTEMGHEFRVRLLDGDREIHAGRQFAGVSGNVYRVGITGGNGGQNTQTAKPEQLTALMRANKQRYANYYERFAWAPCDYSDMTPDTELFWSGQTQYPGSITGLKREIDEAHRLGIKAISYGKSCGASFSGAETYRRFPELFQHSPEYGTGSEAFSTFYLERMARGEYVIDAGPNVPPTWQHWASFWVKSTPEAVDFSARETIASAKMLGWDGVRWDGHFSGLMPRFVEKVNAELPRFVHGYNAAFASPSGTVFTPTPPPDDFHQIAVGHGMVMDESVRDWSHTNFSSGLMRPYWEAIAREADYVKRIGGLPLIITFDMASGLDTTLDVLFALACGQRYTYLTAPPSDFAFGSLPRFLTRYSAFVWDDTARVAEPEKFIRVAAGSTANAKDKDKQAAAPWWQEATWVRRVGGKRQQLLVNLINPPGYPAFCNRVQPPPVTQTGVMVSVDAPAGAKLVRAFEVSPDLVVGLAIRTVQSNDRTHSIELPRLRAWSIAVFEFETDDDGPLLPLTDPVGAADKAAQDAKAKAQKEAEEKQAAAGLAAAKPPASKAEATADAKAADKTAAKTATAQPLVLRRNGLLDVVDVRGLFAWLTPLDAACALADGTCRPAYVDRVGFRLGPAGSLEGFPDAAGDLESQDVVVLDDVHAIDLGADRAARIACFVRGGGGLLVIGGPFNLSSGNDHTTALAEILPVTHRQAYDLATDVKGLQLAPAGDAFEKLDWSPLRCLSVDTSPLAEGATVLATAGSHPAIVERTVGAGRVIAVMVTPLGDFPESIQPYYRSPQWAQVLATCLRRLGEGAEKLSSVTARKPNAEGGFTPESLLIEAEDLPDEKLAAAILEAADSAASADEAGTVLDVLIDSLGRIDDAELALSVVDRLAPVVDASCTPRALTLTTSQFEFVRVAGYRLLRFCGDPAQASLLANALDNPNADIAREALLALGKTGDRGVVPKVEKLSRAGDNRLLAHLVLRQLGGDRDSSAAWKAYIDGEKRAVGLTAARKSIEGDLYGGTSFKLTRAARKTLINQLRRMQRLETQARSDVAMFMRSFDGLTDEEVASLGPVLAESQSAAATVLAFSVLPKLSDTQAKTLRQALAAAKLEELRWLSTK
jgi:hypothetical protein